MTIKEFFALKIGDMVWRKDGKVRELISEICKDEGVAISPEATLWTRPAYFPQSSDSLDIPTSECGDWNVMPNDINELPQNVINTLIWLKLSSINSKLHRLTNRLEQAARWD